MISPQSKRPYIFTNISSCLRVILCTSVLILLTVITLPDTGNQDNILPLFQRVEYSTLPNGI